jgi:peptidoglycan/LPS O-acetylase OafA/YrhL
VSSAEPTAVAPERPGRLAYVDGWRAIAVSLVVAAHLLGALGLQSSVDFGTLGVHVFFLISGFIITWLSLREVTATGTFNQARFIARRALRILPPMLAYLLVVIILRWSDASQRAAVARALLFTCNINLPTSGCSWLTGHTWSLAFEEQFYLLFPFVLTRRIGPFFLFALAAYLLPFLMPIHHVGRIGHLQITGLFCAGMAYARWRDSFDAAFKRMGALTVVLPAGLLSWWLPMPPSTLQKIIGMLEPAALLLLVFGAPAAFQAIQRLLGHVVLARIGLYSYSIYLWQQLMLDKSLGWPWWGYVAGIAGSIAIAGLSYHFYESYFRAISARSFHSTAPAMSATQPYETVSR